MRKTQRLAFTALLFAPGFICLAQGTQQTSASTQPQTQTQDQAKPQASTSPAASSVAEAARKARENQKKAQSAPMVFTNENLPKSSAISIVGNTAPRDAGQAQAEAAADAKSEERMWRQKFADARAKLREDKEKLTSLKNDLSALGMVRYFNEHDAVTKQQAVADQENQINADQKAIDDLEDALRKAGGDPSWAN